ncbi:MAG: dihydrodipicolinate synthase family protein [Spirochaetales bacterium]|nr:dihydrodipicolinate synthase family protein [Spirochaetales bacterium]
MANLPEKEMTILASGHTADDVLTQQREAEAIASTGIDSYVFIANRFAKEDEGDDVLLKNAAKVVKAVPNLPLGVYECPYPYKRMLNPKVMRDLLEIGDFQFLKDTTCDVAKMDEKIKAMKGTNFKLFNANSATLLESLEIGANGFSGVMANFHPELYQDLYQLFLAKDPKAELLQDFIGFYSVAECQIYPVNAKYYLGTLEGLGFGFHTRTRNPAVEFPRNRQLEMDQMWRLTQLWKKQKMHG